MNLSVGVRTRIAVAAAIATVFLLSLVGAFGYRAMVEATRDSQLALLNTRLDELEDQLQQQLDSGDRQFVGRLQIDSSLRVIRASDPVPPPIPQTLRVVRSIEDPEIEAIVGLVDTRRIDATLNTIRVGLWISVVVTGLVVGATAWFVVGWALAPVRRLTRQAEANMDSRALEPLSSDSGGDEIAELASTFNAMLRRLRTADVERRRFVSDASHELRTPLMVLSADAEFAIDHPSDSASPATSELAETVLAQSERLTSLVDDLLLLASLDEEPDELLEMVSVAEIVMIADIGPLVGELPPALDEVLIPNISKSVANVVANARRHCADNVSVSIEIVATADSKTVRFTVDDDGPGIPRSERHQIFKRFYRPDGDRNRSEGGAGLGLAIAKAQVTKAGGTISIGGNPSGGARFVIAVPALRTSPFRRHRLDGRPPL